MVIFHRKRDNWQPPPDGVEAKQRVLTAELSEAELEGVVGTGGSTLLHIGNIVAQETMRTSNEVGRSCNDTNDFTSGLAA